MHYAAFFQYANHDKIAAARPAHRAYLTNLVESGNVVAAGPFEDDSGALIIYEAASQEEAEQFLREDPFHAAGVFASWTMKPWKKVLPTGASNPAATA